MGILTVDLHLPEAGSLKDKRREVLRVKNVLARRLSCSVAEVDHHDLWQRARVTLCVADRSAADAQERLARARRLLDTDERFQVVDERHALVGVEEMIDGWDAHGAR